MTLDEAIKHCQDKYEELKRDKCEACAEDHKQLAEWLIELKRLQERNQQLSNEINDLKREFRIDN